MFSGLPEAELLMACRSERDAGHRPYAASTRRADVQCAACGGSAIAVAPLDYPDFDKGVCCEACDVGRALAYRLAQIVERTLKFSRPHPG
jgi:hypothetical protein